MTLDRMFGSVTKYLRNHQVESLVFSVKYTLAQRQVTSFKIDVRIHKHKVLSKTIVTRSSDTLDPLKGIRATNKA